MDVQDSFDLRVEQISIAVGVQLQLIIQPGLKAAVSVLRSDR